MPNFGSLMQTSIGGPAIAIIVFDEDETLALDPRTLSDAIVHQYTSEVLRSVKFHPPEKIIRWGLTLKRYSREKSEAWLEVEFE